MFHIPISTLRYYDKEGLFPHMERVSGIRKFSDSELEALHVIECLKKSGLEIKEIKQFMTWCAEGSTTYPQRKQLFEERKQALQQQMLQLQKALDMIQFKCWYYEQAIKDGNGLQFLLLLFLMWQQIQSYLTCFRILWRPFLIIQSPVPLQKNHDLLIQQHNFHLLVPLSKQIRLLHF